jgi:AAA15 family ATPase/GTPase
LILLKKIKYSSLMRLRLVLHTKLVEYIIELFHAGKSAQLIYTTHNTKLLDLNKLRKDQVYFANKKEDASTDLYSLFDYKDFRDTMDAEKAYLQGRFDAIPYINDSIENLKIFLNEPSE